MPFTIKTKDEARLRQDGKCGLCGISLDDEWEEAHHIKPQALGIDDSVENCVVLCGNCHDRVHNDSKFNSKIVAPKDYYEYFNG